MRKAKAEMGGLRDARSEASGDEEGMANGGEGSNGMESDDTQGH